MIVATTSVDNERSGHFRAGEEVVILVHLRQCPRAWPIRPISSSRIAGRASISSTATRELLVRGHGATAGGLVDVPVQSAIEPLAAPYAGAAHGA